MQHALNLVVAALATLFGLVVAAIGAIETALRHLLQSAGIVGPAQTIVLLVVFVLLVIAAIRLLGGVFGVLIAIVLLILLAHALLAAHPLPG